MASTSETSPVQYEMLDRVAPDAGPLERVARRIGRRLGWDVYRRRSDFHYVPSLYGDRYFKLADIREHPGFGELAAEVIGHGRTYMGYARLFTLWQAVTQAPEGAIAELGVFRGGSSWFLAAAAEQAGGGRRIFSFDTFTHFPETDLELDGSHRPTGDYHPAEDVRRYLSRFASLELREGVFPDTAAGLEDERFGVVHVDSDTYSSYRDALAFFVPRLAPGGIVVLDDYGFVTCPGATQATDEFLAEHGDEVQLFSLLTGQALLIRRSGR